MPVRAFSKGQANCGVGGTAARTTGTTASSSARVNIFLPYPSPERGGSDCRRQSGGGLFLTKISVAGGPTRRPSGGGIGESFAPYRMITGRGGGFHAISAISFFTIAWPNEL